LRLGVVCQACTNFGYIGRRAVRGKKQNLETIPEPEKKYKSQWQQRVFEGDRIVVRLEINGYMQLDTYFAVKTKFQLL